MQKIFITGESGAIPMAIQKILNNSEDYDIINSQLNDKYNLNKFKKHQAFEVRQPEIDFLDNDLLNNKLDNILKQTNIIIHSGAYVGTDFCNNNQELAIKTNVDGTLNIVNICNRYNIKLIYFSTTAIFDPNDYSENDYITEFTKINPQTLYGITKYAGELIVKNMCKTEHVIVRPVFGFGDYPNDLHSALTKIIHNIYYNFKNNSNIRLKVLLDKNINKSYTRVENIANVVIDIIDRNLFNGIYNVGENYDESKNWFELLDIIVQIFLNKIDVYKSNLLKLIDNIEFISKSDYLHWHNINDSNLELFNLNLKNNKNYTDLYNGIEKTIDSVIKNIDLKPYWI